MLLRVRVAGAIGPNRRRPGDDHPIPYADGPREPDGRLER
jgi:hypothetical protein